MYIYKRAELAVDKHTIFNQKIAPCTFTLKIDLFRDWLNQQGGEITIHIGYDIFEAHRIKKTKAAYEALGYNVDFPLLWEPIDDRDYATIVRDDWGVAPPRTYEMGFSHANCLKRGCVKMGQKDWALFYLHFPLRFIKTAEWERQHRDHPKRKNYAILRDQSGGTVKPLPLFEFKRRLDSGELKPRGLSSICFSCGIGDLLQNE